MFDIQRTKLEIQRNKFEIQIIIFEKSNFNLLISINKVAKTFFFQNGTYTYASVLFIAFWFHCDNICEVLVLFCNDKSAVTLNLSEFGILSGPHLHLKNIAYTSFF